MSPLVLSRMIASHSVRRRLLAVAAAGMVLALLGWTALVLADRSARWLHSQPEFSVPFEGIELVPEPPRALRDGRAAILSRVRERAKVDGLIRLLDQDLRELGLSFAKHSPWVAKVDRVARAYPNRILIQVTYREPVARVDLSPDRFVAVADDGVVIAGEDLIPSIAASLPRLKGFTSPPQDLPGHYLGADRDGRVPAEISAAVALAKFLRASAGADGQPARFASVNVSKGADRLLLRTQGGLWVLWHNAPGREDPDEPAASEKLDRFLQWEAIHHNEPFTDEDCLVFVGNAARLKGPGRPKG